MKRLQRSKRALAVMIVTASLLQMSQTLSAQTTQQPPPVPDFNPLVGAWYGQQGQVRVVFIFRPDRTYTLMVQVSGVTIEQSVGRYTYQYVGPTSGWATLYNPMTGAPNPRFFSFQGPNRVVMSHGGYQLLLSRLGT